MQEMTEAVDDLGDGSAARQVRGEVRGRLTELWWQVQDSNLGRHTPTDLQSAPIGVCGFKPRWLFEKTAGHQPGGVGY